VTFDGHFSTADTHTLYAQLTSDLLATSFLFSYGAAISVKPLPESLSSLDKCRTAPIGCRPPGHA